MTAKFSERNLNVGCDSPIIAPTPEYVLRCGRRPFFVVNKLFFFISSLYIFIIILIIIIGHFNFNTTSPNIFLIDMNEEKNDYIIENDFFNFKLLLYYILFLLFIYYVLYYDRI